MARRAKKTGTSEQVAKGNLVKLYAKRLQDGRRSLYLIIRDPRPADTPGAQEKKYRYEFLRMYLEGDRRKDEETRAMAVARMHAADESERDARNVRPDGYNPNNAKRDFFEYFSSAAVSKGGEGHSWASAKKHLLAYAMKQDATDALPFSAITPAWLNGFREYLLSSASGVSRATARMYLGVIGTALRRAVREGVIIANPMERVDRIRTEPSKRTYLTREELGTLQSTPCRRADVRDAFLFSCFTGLRISDVRAITWRNVTGGALDFVQQKTRKHIVIPLSSAALAFMPDVRGEASLPVFPSLPSEVTVLEVLSDWRRAAGLEKHVTMHVGRHTYATGLLNSGADIKTVADLLGDNLRNAEVYAKLMQETKRSAVDRMAAHFSDTHKHAEK